MVNAVKDIALMLSTGWAGQIKVGSMLYDDTKIKNHVDTLLQNGTISFTWNKKKKELYFFECMVLIIYQLF